MFKKKEKRVRLITPDELPPSEKSLPDSKHSLSSASEPTITLAGTDRPVEYAGFIRRAFALFIDQAIVIVSQWLLLIPSALSIVYDSTWGWVLFCLSFISILVMQYWIYTAFFEHSRWQATPGKFLVGLKVTDLKGNPLTFWKSSFRLLIQYILLLIMTVVLLYGLAAVNPLTHGFLDKGNAGTTVAYLTALVVGYCYVLFSAKKQTLFDKAAGRLVVFQEGYANTQQMTSFECFKRSFSMLPHQLKQFVKVGKEGHGRVKLILAASLAVAAYGWAAFAVFQIAQNVLGVEKEIAAHQNEDFEKPKVSLKNMESVYSTLQKTAANLGLKDLETELQRRAMLFQHDPRLIISRANKYMDTGKLDLAEKDIKRVLRDSTFESEFAFRSMVFSSNARLMQLSGQQKEARKMAIRSLQANPYNQEAVRILTAADKALKIDDKSLLLVAKSNPLEVYGEDAFRGLGYYGDRLEPCYQSERKKLEEKLAECDKVLKLMPDCTQALLVKAETLKSLSRQKEADQVGLEAIASDKTWNQTLTKYIDNLDNSNAAATVITLRKLSKTANTAYIHSRIASVLQDQAINIDDDNKQTAIQKEALVEIEKAVQMDPQCRSYVVSLAEAFEKLDRYSDAINAYKRALAIEIDKDSTDYQTKDATIYTSISSAYESLDKIPQAIEALDKAIASESDSPSNYEAKGDLLVKLERYEEAIPCFDRAIAIKQDLTNVAKDKAMDLLMAVIVPKATRKDASLSKVTDEQVMTYYRKRGEAYEKIGDNAQALADFEQTANSSYSEGDERIAHLYCIQGMPEKAIEAYTRSISKKPEDPMRYLRRAMILEALGQKEKASQDRTKAIRVAEETIAKEKSPESYKNAAEVYFAVGNYSKALQYLDKRIALDGNDDSVLIEKAQVYAAQKNFPAALKLANNAYKGEKDCRCQAFQRGDVHLACGQFKTAEKMFSDALAEDPADGKSYMRRSIARTKLGMKEKAAEDLAKAQEFGYDKDPVLKLAQF